MKTEAPIRWFLSEQVLRQADLPRRLVQHARQLGSEEPKTDSGMVVAVALASELYEDASRRLPQWAIGTDTWYLVLNDLPVPALMHLPAALRLHRPDQRLHVTEDPLAVRRLLIAQLRPDPAEGIVDAYIVGEVLNLRLGDRSSRTFPIRRIPSLERLPAEEWPRFEIDEDGSFLHWTEHDLHLGVSQLLQAVDPAYLADIETTRYSKDYTGAAVAEMRESCSLRQSDIPGLSERQVRRIERGISRLTSDAAAKFATVFGKSLREFLDEMARRVARLRAEAEVEEAEAELKEEDSPHVLSH
ncbi:MAG: DUF2442 domain-containing protein [Gemmatimonadota bacterium]|nr:DUF2442 domain-containing protein [Gemmatimonadota bacterium]